MRGEALRDADAEAELVAALLPACGSAAPTRSRIASAMRTARSAASGTGTGSLKKIIMPSPVKRSSVPSCARISSPHRGVVLAQHAHHLLGLGGLREGGEAAQVENTTVISRRWLLQRVVGAAADDQLGELRREEARAAGRRARARRPARRRAARAWRSTAAPRAASASARSCSALMRSIERTRATSAAWSTGLVRYSSPPASSPATTSLVSAIAVTRMIGVNGNAGSARSRLQTSMPSSLGIMMSSRIRSGSLLARGGQRLFAVGGRDDLVALGGQPGLRAS